MKSFGLRSYVCIVTAFCIATAVASPAQTFTHLSSFLGTNGANPFGPLVQGWNGDFYGTTLYGGPSFDASTQSYGYGTVFEVTPNGKLTTLYNFCSLMSGKICLDGSSPNTGLVLGADGKFYGTTQVGGSCKLGTFFQITTSGTLTTLYNFCSIPGGIIQAADGNFYGTTEGGGTSGDGTVFRVTASGVLTTLHSLVSNTDGSTPVASLVQASNGTFYGVAANGGGNSKGIAGGTVFGITRAGQFFTLHSFCALSGCTDGYAPEGTLIQGSDGNLYGTTAQGGTHGAGTIFKLTLNGQLTTLYNLCSVTSGTQCLDGDFLGAGLAEGTDGNFYGTTAGGGSNAYNAGTVFEITPSGILTTLYVFCTAGCVDGTQPLSVPLQSTSGAFYGNTNTGGHFADCFNAEGAGCGTIFSFSTGLEAFVRANPVVGPVGRTIDILGNRLTGATSVTFNGTSAVFTVVSGSHIKATVPTGATTGPIQVTTPTGTLSSNKAFRVIP